ncbi:hypothetical protein SS1G_08533 [Sclerotinia sclerotiorum 1980 UF-70]|uniref:RCC1-like domain-containing protein n=2 Tax=Sclerotinia sclerotiorum (strain ATCC 18683 / 1980 / Ss-1) TaxID=665079 RepID=A0A1D9QE41_SCLS1|nr:hypothetical protein SS1G_08533 [Sclerotinia sclerotiorum 1980 UF-70]APA13032.1 hypothetical protein sscle_10g078020 [Sclerotinia sclerotiorum 1980 UF-70]EDN92670.1 hypothetical protein SS1G_08533 [Sclerotinia sclerotiorum 1980 UF-70]
MPPKKIPSPPTRVSTRKPSSPKKSQVEANTSKVMKALAPKKAGVAKNVAPQKKVSPVAKKTAKAQPDVAKKPTTATKSTTVKKTTITKAAMAKKVAAAKAAPAKPAAPKSNKRKSTEDVDEPAAKPSKKAKVIKPTVVKKLAVKAADKPTPAAKKPKASPKPKAPKVVKPKIVKPKVEKPKTIINVAPTQLLDIYVFGCNEAGELGLGLQTKKDTINRPVKNPALTALGVVQMVAGGMHGAALTKDNKILTWGVSDGLALGRKTDDWVAPERDADADSDDESDAADARNPLESTPGEVDMTNVPEGTIFTQITAGDNATYALTNDGLVYGWGSIRGADGPMGFTKDVKETLVPMLIPGLKNIVKLAAGNNHYLALNNKGSVFAWGAGEHNQLGRRIVERSRLNALVPREFGLPKAMVDIFCGSEHSFALHKNGTVYSWGANNMGQCGQFTKDGALAEEVTSTATKVDILKGKNIKMMAAGNASSLALTHEGEVMYFGKALDGLSGHDVEALPEDVIIRNERDQRSIIKTPLSFPFKGSYIAMGSDHSIVLGPEGKSPHHSWGFNTYRQTGLENDQDVYIAEELNNKNIEGKKLVWAAGGGQFTFLAGIPEN